MDSLKIIKVVRQLTSIILIKTAPKLIRTLSGIIKLDKREFNNLVDVDDAVTVCGQQDDVFDQIKASYEAEEEDEEIDNLPLNVTNRQALSAMNTLKIYVERQQLLCYQVCQRTQTVRQLTSIIFMKTAPKIIGTETQDS